MGVAATICVPLVKDGRLTALMAEHTGAGEHAIRILGCRFASDQRVGLAVKDLA